MPRADATSLSWAQQFRSVDACASSWRNCDRRATAIDDGPEEWALLANSRSMPAQARVCERARVSAHTTEGAQSQRAECEWEYVYMRAIAPPQISQGPIRRTSTSP